MALAIERKIEEPLYLKIEGKIIEIRVKYGNTNNTVKIAITAPPEVEIHRLQWKLSDTLEN